MSRDRDRQMSELRPPIGRLARKAAILAAALLAVLLTGAVQAQEDVNVVLNGSSLSNQHLIVGTGFHALNLVNRGTYDADFTVYRLRKGASLEKFTAANQELADATASGSEAHEALEALEETAVALGGLNVSDHSSKTMLVDLSRGTYVVASIPEDGGEITYSTFRVMGPNDDSGGPQVAAETVVDMKDFAFDLPADVAGGTNLWKVSNTGTQPHVADFYRLLPGRTMEDLIAYLSGEGGQQPYDKTESISMVSAGETVYLPVNFESGNWVALCFVPDMDNPDLSHVMEGMVAEFRVL